MQPIMRITFPLSLSPHGPAPAKLLQTLQRLRSASGVFSVDNIIAFDQHVAPKFKELLAGTQEEGASDILYHHFEGFGSIHSAAKDVSELDALMRQFSIGRAVERLRSFSRIWKRRLGDPIDAPGELIADGIEHDIPTVIDLIAVQIEMGTARRYAVDRLRVFFEHFECERLRQELSEAQASKKSREKILQDAMDRFLFHDGYYPITHSVASRGSLDTLILERGELLTTPPLLVELKQVTAFEAERVASAKQVKNAVEEARGEVERYRGHVASTGGRGLLLR